MLEAHAMMSGDTGSTSGRNLKFIYAGASRYCHHRCLTMALGA